RVGVGRARPGGAQCPGGLKGQRALADAPLAGAARHEMAPPGEPVGNPGALLGDLLEDSGPAVADDVVVALHVSDVPGSLAYTVPGWCGGDASSGAPASRVAERG